ncbi:ABC exporter membrane fusion protein [Lusitaniella coriacea LEGE 07157]|uniref:ABC exporter membrane fusion protein n=1 Tax=Lusitaniella coriacea LEGE 07157 TaxID=945747 RepID=A0A8J7DUS8_9CYAN|nr:ABC exporter membrane fusion protein [Lusitaniella coriacea]MBE9114290.1 ABC exporter membrane fusion protein [Lusitaniella coriacea LEGE 07157]
MKIKSLGKQKSWWLAGCALAIALPLSVFSIYTLQNSRKSTSGVSSSDLELLASPNAIAALGFLEPEGEVVRLSGTVANGARVDKLLVKQGEQVKTGQIVAILDSRDRLLTALKKSQTQVKIAESRLAQVKAGAKQGEINAQKARVNNLQAELQGQKATQQATIERLESNLKGNTAAQQATIERLEAELRNAQNECNRFERLYLDGAVTTSDRDRKCLEQKTARQRVVEAKVTLKRIVDSTQDEIEEAQANLKRTIDTIQQQQTGAKATLNQIAEVRDVDVGLAQAELEDAIAGVQQAQAELDLAYVRAPSSGQILKIHTFPGEIISDRGIVELGQTRQMYVKAEVYETDISQVRLGQPSSITSDGFPGELTGVVDEIGLQIGKKEVLSTNPAVDVDARVVEVKIRLDLEDSQKVAGLTNLQVQVVIDSSNE